MLRWLGPRLHDPSVWHVGRESCARGVAIGFFFGLLVPAAQFPVAALFAILLRANLAVSVVSTLVTNPFTFAPIYYMAYVLGSHLLGLPPAAVAPTTFQLDTTEVTGWLDIWSQRVLAIGKPLFLGLFLMAVTSSGAAYLLVHWIWRASTVRAWNQRRRRATVQK
jgi:uncharacterized protein (DUF2062 family)